jgi:hypothetical protein
MNGLATNIFAKFSYHHSPLECIAMVARWPVSGYQQVDKAHVRQDAGGIELLQRYG